RDLLSGILESESDITVIGTASNGVEAVRLARLLAPDIITMDINMPGMDGFEAARQIMEESPIPIIIISGVDNLAEIAASFRVMEAGALTILPKPPHPTSPDFLNKSKDILNAIRTYVEIRVIRRTKTHHSVKVTHEPVPNLNGVEPRLIVIGASTGGPPVIQTILRNLNSQFSIPLVLVQHMSPGFILGFAEWLSESTGFRVTVPHNDELLLPGSLYVVPDEVQAGVTSDLRIVLSDAPCEHNLRPSVSYLFRSVAETLGKNAVGILLTGMGTDGSHELLQMRKKGSVTIIQDKTSSVVYGMPGEALRIGAASMILSPEEIAQELKFIAR
ncbi:MAG: response regulator, partial [Methanospirillum sp.]|uniref:chemotaxis protein CheB n=1 Tax=Methanospirillum sp. TaxID=45200 RepID=UPI002369178E